MQQIDMLVVGTDLAAEEGPVVKDGKSFAKSRYIEEVATIK